MRRYLSLSKSSNLTRNQPASSNSVEAEKAFLLDGTREETSDSPVPKPFLHPPNLKIKRVDHFFSRWSKKWKYENTSSGIIPELRTTAPVDSDAWSSYCFVVVREIPQVQDKEPWFKVIIKSPYLINICKKVIGEVPGISFNTVAPEVDPKLLLSFLPHFEAYKDDLKSKRSLTEEEGYSVSTVSTLIDYIRTDYRATIATLNSLTSHGEVTFDLLFAIFVPRTILVAKCPVTGELQALQLMSASRMAMGVSSVYVLLCESLDVDDGDSATTGFCRVQTRIWIPEFKGTVKINSLEAYPIMYHPQEAQLRDSLITRGRKWANFSAPPGIHHRHYHGTAAFKTQNGIVKYNLDSRVMIDRGNFRRLHPNYSFPVRKVETLQPVNNNRDDLWMPPGMPPNMDQTRFDPNSVPSRLHHQPQRKDVELTDDDLLLASPVVYGFSLSDKVWLEFNVEKITEVAWNTTAFANLVIPPDRKTLLKSLVEAHNAELGFDDFIRGKGRGLVVNLYGPTGVGKTLSAEATSEHVKRPLYVVGAGDLGTKAAELDVELQRIFELATAWKAIVLIDEADVFLEQRSLHDLERNAMVAIFLRHLEYYPSILFLTTNRVKTFDGAFLSRIHVGLHFQPLSASAREQVWVAFLKKAGVTVGVDGGVTMDELTKLGRRDINGRQVKNVTKTAHSLAASRGEPLRYDHLAEVLDSMEQFSADFENLPEQV